MGKNNKDILNESGSLNLPKNTEREVSNTEKFITKLLGKIYLTKKVFFGFDEKKIAIVVTPSLRVAAVVSSPSKLVNDFPIKRGDEFNKDIIINYAEKNGYDISFSAPTPQLKMKLYNMFGDVLVENKLNENKESNISFEQNINDSLLPESIKKWALDNPEKFLNNLKNIKNLLS